MHQMWGFNLNMSHRDGALAWWNAGMSVIPILANGTKRPQLKWEKYQHERPTLLEVNTWWRTSAESGVGIICGAVSGNLEMLELEGRANTSDNLDSIIWECEQRGVADIWARLLSTVVAGSPSGGIHLIYRVDGAPVPGNTKIARRPATAEELAENSKDKIKVLSETRGEGGYFVAAPSHGTVHKSGDAWTMLSGEVGGTPAVITWEQRCLIHEAIHAALDEMPEQEVRQVQDQPVAQQTLDGLAPGADFNARTNWRTLLEAYGWTYHSNRGTEQLWTRSGKKVSDGHSASLYYQGSDNLYVWSSSTELPQEEPISKFAFYTFMEHRGDFSAAASALYHQGYGERRDVLDLSDWFPAEEADEATRVGAVVDPQAPAVEGPSENKAAKVARQIEQFTEKGIGRFAGKLLKDRVRWVSQERAWRVYSNGAWERDHGNEVKRLVEKVSDLVDLRVDEIYAKAKDASESGQADGKEQLDAARHLKTFAKGIATNRGMKAVAEIMIGSPGISVSAETFDLNMNLICLDNGTLDLTTQTLREHRPTDMLTKRIPLAYDPSAVAHRWIQYLEEVIPDPAYRDYLQRAAGMALLGDTSESAFFVLWGETGCGKSQFLEVMNAVFGDYGVTAAASAFRESRNGDDSRKSNSLHALRGARYVATSETSEKSALNAEVVKRVTGGDSIKTHALYETEIEWKPAFTMFMGTNFRPVLDASDGAIWRRVKPIQFPRTFFVDNQPTEDREKDLAGRIIATELAGVFNWLLEGVLAYKTTGLKDPDSMHDAVKEYREDSDPVLAFLSEAVDDGTLIREEKATSTTTDLYRVFVAWSRDNGVTRIIGKNKFSMRLESLGFTSVKGSNGVRMRKGLALNPNAWLAQAQGR
jgi:P4 family phage/plasmid primase-like protien